MPSAVPPAPYHGQFRKHAARSLVLGLAFATLAGLTWKYGFAEPRKKRYADFYKTYDPVAEGKRMSEAGVFKRGGSGKDFKLDEEDDD